MSEPEVDPVTIKRQMDCKHSFIRGTMDTEKRCPRCGVSEADWERMLVAYL